MGLALIFLAWVCLTLSAATATPMSKPGCPEKCGNITIPYPFGIGPECSANSSYTVICRNSTNAFLSSINMEALDISLRGTIMVKQPLLPMNRSSEQKTQSSVESLLGTPFNISAERNSFVNLGCQNSVWLLLNGSTSVGGCMAICDANSTETSCNGVNCCQTTFPEPLKELQFTYKSIQSSNRNSCGYAFLAERDWFVEDYKTYRGLHDHDLANPLDNDFGYAHVVLEWEIDCNGTFSPYISCIQWNKDYGYMEFPGETGFYSRSLINYCKCRNGFEGNPYLPEGCIDIDECRGQTFPYCYSGTCINTLGSYKCQHDKFRLQIAFIVVGSGLGALILLIGSWRTAKLVRGKIKTNRKRKFFKRNGGLLLAQELSSTNNGLEKIKLFTSKELVQATDHYNENRILGLGGQGTVYKGMLTDGRIVAVKKSKRVDENDLDVFINEVAILSQINHRNVVKLLGCCLETEVPLLVYEFIPNGTLFQHIHDQNEELPLLWEMRVRIATEVARALSYMHSAASAPIFHRDIKSTNILLDDKYRAKVADFGTSRSVSIDQTHLTTRVLGTFGYLDPEYFQSSQFTEKSDIYSFGVVMVELLTGEKAISSIRPETGRSLATHFLHSIEENRLFNILDDCVVKEGRKEEIVAIAEIARRCLNLNGRRRPTMKEVAAELEGIQMLKEGSVFPLKQEIMDFHSVDLYEAYEFPSISESMQFDSITADADGSDINPLLVDEP